MSHGGNETSKLHCLYVIGVPGVGKSALVAELVKGRRRRVRSSPFTHTVYADGLVQLGRERGSGFSGTDTLSMSACTNAVALLEARWPRIIAEGDRLATPIFFDAAKRVGYNLDVVLLTAPQFVLTKRRKERDSNQDKNWLAGRETKVRNVAEKYATVTLDATMPLDWLVDQLRDHPVFKEVSRVG